MDFPSVFLVLVVSCFFPGNFPCFSLALVSLPLVLVFSCFEAEKKILFAGGSLALEDVLFGGI